MNQAFNLPQTVFGTGKKKYFSQNPSAIGNYSNSRLDIVRQVIQKWIDAQNVYPELNSDEKYSFFAEKMTYKAIDREAGKEQLYLKQYTPPEEDAGRISLYNMNPYDFEQLVADYYVKRGYV